MTKSIAHEDRVGWSINILGDAFKRLVQQKLCNLDACLFIDGLDEYDGKREEIVDLVENIVSSPEGQRLRIKACISSRPYTAFEHGFRKHLQLKVQDLTRPDIEKFTSDTLRSYSEGDSIEEDREMTQSLITQVVDKASGVFMWVRLVTESLGNGLRDGDTVPELQAKLAEIPPTLEGLYSRMLQKIEPQHSSQAAEMIQILLHARQTLSLLELALADLGSDEALACQIGISM